MRPTFVALLPSVLAALSSAGGCGFDPGHDYAVTSTWLLNGAAPDATRCKELGIAQFRLTMNGPGPATTLQAACERTLQIERVTYGGFETTRAFDFGVAYEYRVEALDAQGHVLYAFPAPEQAPLVVSATQGDFVPVDLYTVDVFEPFGDVASFSAAWVFGDSDLATDCARNGIKRVQLWVASATDPEFVDYDVVSTSACKDGKVASDGNVLARGEYFVKYVALDDRDAVAEASEAISASIDRAGDLALPRHKFQGL